MGSDQGSDDHLACFQPEEKELVFCAEKAWRAMIKKAEVPSDLFVNVKDKK